MGTKLRSCILALLVTPGGGAPGQSAEPSWVLGPFMKDDSANPILTPSPEGEFPCPIRHRLVRWEELAIYNPAAVVREDQVFLLYRAQDKDGTSRLGLATSHDGVRFVRGPRPVLYPDEDTRKGDEWPGGCEDPRLVDDEHGRHVLTYTAYDGTKARLAVATSRDLRRWTKHGLAFGDKHRELWSKSGAIVCRFQGPRCVAERVAGRYWMLWGDTSVFAATSDDLLAWTPILGEDGKPAPVLAPRRGRFDSELVEPGPPAFLTDRGIVLLYNARNAAGEAGNPRLPEGAYTAGQVLLDAKDPRRVLDRTEEGFLRPDLGHEKEGQVRNVVFVEGLVPFAGRWRLYYGTADSRLAVASAPVHLAVAFQLLCIGGTGNISTACVRLAVEAGLQVTVLTRGQKPAELPASVLRVTGDASDPGTLADLAGRRFDGVVDFVGFDAADARRDVEAFRGRVGQYVFISSASVYRKPPPRYLVTEGAPLGNPHWEYARKKIEAEETLRAAQRETGFPVTIVRPSYTYGETWVPTTSGSDYTVVHRLRRGLEIVVPGDGTSLFVLTHATDFARGLVGLLGQGAAIGEAFHITSDEVQTWNQVHETIARVIGVEPRIVHVPSDFIARIDERRGASLLGDKAWSLVFDNSKLHRVVPGFQARVPFAEGVRASIAWFEADSARQRIDANATVERILAAWHRAMGAIDR